MITRSQIQVEIDETSADLKAFTEARDVIRRRVQQVADEARPRLMNNTTNWSGTDCVLGGLDLSIHALERTLEELRRELERAAPDPPALRLVEDE